MRLATCSQCGEPIVSLRLGLNEFAAMSADVRSVYVRNGAMTRGNTVQVWAHDSDEPGYPIYCAGTKIVAEPAAR